MKTKPPAVFLSIAAAQPGTRVVYVAEDGTAFYVAVMVWALIRDHYGQSNETGYAEIAPCTISEVGSCERADIGPNFVGTLGPGEDLSFIADRFQEVAEYYRAEVARRNAAARS